MPSLSSLVGGSRTPRAIINRTSTTGATADTLDIGAGWGFRQVASGTLGAGTLADVLNITGGGELNFVVCQGVDATTRTHRFKLTLDGVVVYDATTAAVAAVRSGIVLVGGLSSISATPSMTVEKVTFNSSCLLQYASSLGETGKTTFGLLYKTY